MNELSNVGAKANKGGGSGGPELKKVNEMAQALEDRVDTLELDYKKHIKQTEENCDYIKAQKEVAAKRSARKEKDKKSPKPTSSRVEFKAAGDTNETNKAPSTTGVGITQE